VLSHNEQDIITSSMSSWSGTWERSDGKSFADSAVSFSGTSSSYETTNNDASEFSEANRDGGGSFSDHKFNKAS
jgi:hypothetical protein